jgi:hypothetical protein
MAKQKTLPTVGIPVPYKGCYIVRVSEGYDCVDRRTGKWIHMKDSRSAKWNASVWSRLSDEFDSASVRTFTTNQILAGANL